METEDVSLKTDAEQLGATLRYCTLQLVNLSNCDLTKVTLVHTAGDSMNVITTDRLTKEDGGLSAVPLPPLPISYKTEGPYDYWSVRFNNGVSSDIYSTVHRQCNLQAGDEGLLTTAQITTDGTNFYLTVVPGDSGSCKFKLVKNTFK